MTDTIVAGPRRNPIGLAVALLVVPIVANARLQKNFLKSGIMVSDLTTFLPLMMIAVGLAFVVKGGPSTCRRGRWCRGSMWTWW